MTSTTIYRSKTPLRISFAGGGTEVSPSPEERGSAVPNTTIGHHAYRTIALRHDDTVQAHSLDHANQAIIDHVGDGSHFGVDMIYSVETEPLGTAGALALARPYVPSTALALNGDTFYADDLAPMLAQHQATGAAMTIGAGSGDGRAGGQMVTDAACRVTRFAEKSEVIPAAWVSAGLYLLEPAVLAAIPTGRAVSLERETIPALLATDQPVYVYPLQHGFWDMGTPDGYARLAAHLAAHTESGF